MTFTFTDWAESVDSEQTHSVSMDDAFAQCTIDVDGKNYEDALQFILPITGLQDVDANSTIRLLRHIPVKWPFTRDQDLWAYATKSIGVGSKACVRVPVSQYTLNPNSFDPYFGSPFPPGSPLNYNLDGTPFEKVSVVQYIRYEKYQITVDFRPLTYRMITDDALGSYNDEYDDNIRKFPEWYRWCTWTFEPRAELLQLSGSSMQFVENPAPDPFTGNVRPPQGTFPTFPVPLGLIEQKGIVTCHWRNVPADYILSSSGVPSNILDQMGTVNAFAMTDPLSLKNYDPQTLLLQDMPQMIVKPHPIYRRDDSGIRYFFPWQYDIIVKWIWFDPVLGNDDLPKDAAGQGIWDNVNRPFNLPPINPPNTFTPSVKRPRGHNLLPPAGQAYYLYATRLPQDKKIPANAAAIDNINNPPLHRQSDHRDIFQYVRV